MSTILMTFSIDRALDNMAVRHDFFRQASVFFYLVLTCSFLKKDP